MSGEQSADRRRHHLERHDVASLGRPRLCSRRCRALERAALAEIRKEIEQKFEQKLTEIQDTSLKFGDVFIAGKVYRPNTFAVSKGSLWISRAETIDPPGSSTSWQLVCKQGAFDKPRAA